MKHYSQILPPLLPAEYEALKASIASEGVQVAVVVDPDGNLIDGLHRQEVCNELGINCPTEVRQFESEAEKLELALSLNCHRRQLNRSQKRDLIAAYLQADPAISDNHLAGIIGGISKNTVAAVRAELERTCQIDKLVEFRGRDGKKRPRKYRIIANSTKELETAKRVILTLPDSANGKILDTTTAKRRSRRHEHKQSAALKIMPPTNDDGIQLFHCRFQELEIESESVDLICTDIPYGKEFLPELDDLGAFAKRVLKKGGLLRHLLRANSGCDKVLVGFFPNSLTYRWINASVLGR